MKSKKNIENSLKNKIVENEKKLKNLMGKTLYGKNKMQDNEDNKENKPYNYNKDKPGRRKYSTLTEARTNNETVSGTIDESLYMKETLKKKNTVNNYRKNTKNKPNIYYPMKTNKNNELIDIYTCSSTLTNHYSFITKNKFKTKNNSKNKITNNNNKKSNKSSNKLKKDSTSKIVSKDKKNNNSIKNKKNDKNGNKSFTEANKLEQPPKLSVRNSMDLSYMLERFQDHQKKKIENLEKLKKQIEAKEKEEFTYHPHICQRTKNLTKELKEDFITRQKLYNDLKNNNANKLKETLLKDEQEKINKNNYLLQRKFKENASMASGLNNSFLSEFSCTRSMAEIDSSISKLFEWENRRKAKLIKRQSEKNIEIEKNKHIPQIDKRSNSLAARNRNRKRGNVYERLSKEDDVVVEKKKILKELLTPTFKPNLNLTFRKTEDYEFDEKNNNNKYKRNSLNEGQTIIRIIVNRNNNIKPKIENYEESIVEEENEKIEDEKLDDEMIEDDYVTNMFRRTIINNINKKLRNKSFEKRKSKRYYI